MSAGSERTKSATPGDGDGDGDGEATTEHGGTQPPETTAAASTTGRFGPVTSPRSAMALVSRIPGLEGERARSAGIVTPFVTLFIVLSFVSSAFFTKANLLNILDQQASTLVIAAAGTLVLVSGGIDLSVGAIYGLSAVIAGELALHFPAGLAIAIGVLSGLAAGLFNGIISTFFRINSLIATLATSFIFGGIASLVTAGNLVVLAGKPAFGEFANTDVIGVHTSTWVMVVVVIVLGLVLARTTIGRYMYAAGGNPEAARLAGVRVSWVRVIAFTLSGGAAALGGIIDSSRVLGAESTNNTTLTFTVLAGIVIGGTSILGGEGVVWRTIVGVLFIALVGNGYALLGLNPLYEQITLGVLIVLAVAVDAWSRGRSH